MTLKNGEVGRVDPSIRRKAGIALRCSILIAIGLSVASCSMPRLPELQMPKLNFSRFYGAAANKQTFAPTRSYHLSAGEIVAVRSVVQAAFESPVLLRFLSTNAGLRDDGALAVCGLVTARTDEEASSLSYLFRMERSDDGGKFVLRQIANGRTAQLSIYADCRAMSLF